MKIQMPDSRPQDRSRPEAQAAQFNLRSAWLRELERAQLQGWFGARLAPNAKTEPPPDSGQPAAAKPGSGPAAPRVSELSSAAGAPPAPEAGDRAAPEAGQPVPESAGESARQASDALEVPARAPGTPSKAPRSVAADDLPAPSPAPRPDTLPEQAGGIDRRIPVEVRPQEAAPQARASAPAALPVRERPWPARSVHMMSDGSGAKVWIRDSGLVQATAGAILSSLAGELRLRGLRLRALTVNGRVAFESEPASGSGKASRSTFPQEVNRHGND